MPKGEIKVETYRRFRSLIKTRLYKVLAKVTTLTVSALSAQLTPVLVRSLSTYLNEVRRKRADYEGNTQRIIEHADESELATDIDSINDTYVAIVSQIESLLPPEDPLSPTSAANTSFQNLPHTAQQVRFPQLDLKTFDGNVHNWVSYINLFDAKVHHNPSLSSVVKFQYLLSSLKSP